MASVRSVKFLSHKMIWSQNRMKFSNINIASAVLIAFSVIKFCFCIQHYWISEWLHKFSITTSIFIREMQSVLYFLHITSSSHIFPSCWMYFGSLVEQNQSLHQRRAFYQLNLFPSWTLKYAKFPTFSNIYINRRDRKRHPCVRISLMNDTMHSNVIMGMQLMESTILKRISNDKRTERRWMCGIYKEQPNNNTEINTQRKHIQLIYCQQGMTSINIELTWAWFD